MLRTVAAVRADFARHLRGSGLEIGALHSPLPIPNATHVAYSDVLTGAQLDAMYPGSRHPDILSNSEDFPEVAGGTFDFVVANHVLEHLTDPIQALREWHRILRPGGLLLMAVPDKRLTFDHARARTPLAHLIADHASPLPPSERNRDHLLEWAEHVEGLDPGSAAFAEWTARQLRDGYAVHNHVWVAQDVLRLLHHLSTAEETAFDLLAWRNASIRRNEFILLLRRTARSRFPSRVALRCAMGTALVQHPFISAAGALKRVIRRIASPHR